MGRRLEDDAVLIQLREHDGHLSLPEGIVERVIDILWEDIQA